MSGEHVENRIEISDKACSVGLLNKQQVSQLPFQYERVDDNICKITRDTGADLIFVAKRLVKDSELTGKTIYLPLGDGSISRALKG